MASMTDQYNETVAEHYAAYRPPLHQLILKRVLADAGSFSDGLDVGCGTGRSSVALSAFCHHVFAVDPSESMLDVATPHDAITYRKGSAEKLPLPDQSIDIATFAGSLSYANRAATARELVRVCRPNAAIVTYDFQVLIDDVLRALDIATQALDSTYDHSAGFSGVLEFIEILATKERIRLEVSTTELAHILLADSERLGAFMRRYRTAQPLADLAQELDSKIQIPAIQADIFYSLYRFSSCH